jgi:hypothetical protein
MGLLQTKQNTEPLAGVPETSDFERIIISIPGGSSKGWTKKFPATLESGSLTPLSFFVFLFRGLSAA